MAYTEFQVTTNFSFLRGASHPEEMAVTANSLEYIAIAQADHNTLAGIVRGHAAAKKCGIRFIPGCRLILKDGPSLLAYPTNLQGYTQLSNLLTTGNLRTEKGKCDLWKADVYPIAGNIQWVAVPPLTLQPDFEIEAAFRKDLAIYREVFGKQLSLSLSRRYDGDDGKLLHQLSVLAKQLDIPLLATNDVYYHEPDRRELQDILTCIREKCTIYEAGYRLQANAERYLKDVPEMKRLFRSYPEAIYQTQVLTEACNFSLDEIKYQYPKEVTPEGLTPMQALQQFTWQGAHEIYGKELPEKVITAIHHEMDFIGKMEYAEYFLTVHDIVRFARKNGILCQGRGSAANSTVCYCLGITAVDPTKFELLFERFISSARNEPPDIDVDFEHERREEVMQYIYAKYGRDRAGIVATVTQQHQRGSLRDVGKAMGLSADTINRLSGSVWEFTDEWFEGERITEQGLNPDDPHLRKVLELTRAFMGFPRQLGQHTGGFVITETKLSDLCPVLNARMENRTNIEWNKDDIEALGFLKIDILALGMLTCIRKAFDLARDHYQLNWTLANIPQDDPEVYEMICHADTIGVFQIESRAQQSMLPRLRPRSFYDLVIEVAIVRPGPIQGDMVHPYLRRRNGEEPVEFPSPELEGILGRTLGVPLFQEQAMKIAIVAAGFTPAEADELRRSMATFKAKGLVTQFEQKLIRGMLQYGYTEEYARRVFRQLEGFGSYGFPESHAASFALLVYVSAWIKCHYPDIFACALLNSQPMGFYQPAQIISDAKKHGVEIRPVDINCSQWDNTLEPAEGKYHAIRMGFRQLRGFKASDAEVLIRNRGNGYAHTNALRNTGISDSALEILARGDAFRSIALDRRQALWEAAIQDRPELLYAGQSSESPDEQVTLPAMSVSEHVVQDYASMSFSLKAHPVSFVREKLSQLHILTTAALSTAKNGDRVKVAGLVLVRQRPGTAKGVCFMTIEDETSVANLVIFENLFEQYRKVILQSRLIMVEGKLQVEGEVIHVIAEHCYDFTRLLRDLTPSRKETLPVLTLAFADEKSAPAPGDARSKSIAQSIPRSRDFK
ncbi:error-prone DNA polymerase [Flavihumibacter petaseus]|uniref:Error-prone DNA polymerase n=1 Tax=Flavihumibacter petaseus NBRC 106054 TaxID=1220578 RepID=A0A0E9N091_9BACT|nr:error-prone DNA polymerase [Flavihumibacter petaseus]GAO43198.1 error-prone DNA polymerase [Flavihumibacter petaseus NBRC 106054]